MSRKRLLDGAPSGAEATTTGSGSVTSDGKLIWLLVFFKHLVAWDPLKTNMVMMSQLP